MNTLERLRALADSTLASGEEPLAAVKVNYNGKVQSNALSTDPTVGGLADPDGSGPDPDTLVAFPVATQMALLLTGGRILVWGLGFSGKPKEYLGEVPLSAVRGVYDGEIRFGPLVRVVMKSGAALDLEIMRNEDADGFIGQFRHLVGDGSATSAGGGGGTPSSPAPGAVAGPGGDGAAVDPAPAADS